MNYKPPTCSGCPLEFIGEGYVAPQDTPLAKILIVGESPTVESASKGLPFADGGGKILHSLLKSAGSAKKLVSLDYVIRCRVGKIPKTFDPIVCAIRHLFPFVKEKKPNVVMTTGDLGLSVLCGLDKTTKRRGSILKSIHGKVIPSLHPVTLMRQQSMFFVGAADVKKVVKESLFPEVRPLGENYSMFPSVKEIMGWEVEKDSPLAVDIETTWSKYWENALICIGFSTAEHTLCIPWLKQGGGFYWKAAERGTVIQTIQRLLLHPTIYQNGFFDVQVLENIGFKIPNILFDTMLAHHLLYAELPHDLGFICSLHTNLPYYKDEAKSDAGALALTDKTFRGYNCKDVYGTMLAAIDLGKDLRSSNVWDHFRAVTMKLPRILINMQRKGIMVDTKTLKDAIVEYTGDILRLKKEVKALGIPSGTDALKKYLFVTLALPVVKRTKKTKSPSLDKDAMDKLKIKILTEKEKYNGTLSDNGKKRLQMLLDGERAIYLISDLNRKSKVLSTYLRGLPLGPDGRIHCSWLQHGTKNQRLSSRDPNLQNVPEGIARRIYVSGRNCFLWIFDYSQIELRIIAYEAEDFPLIKVFEDGRDPHEENTRAFFNLGPNDKWTEIQRKFCKSFVYCLNYGGGVEAVLIAYPGFMSFREAKIREKQYYAKRPAIALYRERIEAEVRSTRTVINPFGLKRVFFGSLNDNIRSAYNYPIQSGAAHVINNACIRLERAGLMKDCIGQFHDALGFELKGAADVLAIKKIMEVPVFIRGRKVELPVDVKMGKNWDSMKKIDVSKL